MISSIFKNSSAILSKNLFIPALAKKSTNQKGQSAESLGPLNELVRDFIEVKEFYQELLLNKIDFFTGVPDSLLKDFLGFIADNHDPKKFIISNNEGCALSTAAGYHLATGNIPLVFLQNSGIGNIINPIMSLTHEDVYKIPLLLMIGWRGEPGKKDEPQHLAQGKNTKGLLHEIGIDYTILPDYIEGAKKELASAIQYMNAKKAPFAFLVKKQTFAEHSFKTKYTSNYELIREQALDILLSSLKEAGNSQNDAFIATTGFLSRELYEIRSNSTKNYSSDFYCVGSMGHASSIAYGIAIQKPNSRIFCLDGDGACIMHMGAMTNIGTSNLKNFVHVVFNNGCHESVGGQKSQGHQVDFRKIAEGCGYKYIARAESREQIVEEVSKINNLQGPVFLEIMIKRLARKNLGRPKSSPEQNKKDFQKFLLKSF